MISSSCRNNPRHYIPGDLPRAFHRFDAPVEPMAVGRCGKVGLLELALAPRSGRTRIVHQFQQMPLQVFRPLYLDPCRPGMAFVSIYSHGGTLQGDRFRIDLRCEPGSLTHVMTPAATRLQQMERNFATQFVNINVSDDAVLEYLPEPIIPFRDSRFYGRTVLTVAPSATVLMSETLLPGRVAYGERHVYALYWSATESRAIDGRLLFADTLRLEPPVADLHTPGRLGPHQVIATLYIITRRVDERGLADHLHAAVVTRPDTVAGASTLPNNCGVALRILGPTSESVAATLHAAWNAARLAVLGVPAPDRHKQ